MSDIKLFHLAKSKVSELEGKSVTIEKSLQTLIENHLESFLGVIFLATEYSTGQKHAGRIDTLGIDENNCPVIIEYKRTTNENVVNQGLYYLDWLLDHKAEFKLLVMEIKGKEIAEKIEWENARLICIAGDYTKYDSYAVDQMNRNIELIRYKKFEDLLLFELVNATTEDDNNKTGKRNKKGGKKNKGRYKLMTDVYDDCSDELKNNFEEIKQFILNLGDGIQLKKMKWYFAFKKNKNLRNICISTCWEYNSNVGSC